MRVVGFFCEDIRQEASGQETIVGILPDNMNIPVIPAGIPKLGIYCRVQLELDEKPQGMSLDMHLPTGEVVNVGSADADLCATAIAKARNTGIPFAGIVLRAMIAPFHVQQEGLVRVILTAGKVETNCAALHIKPVNPSSASEQPFEQSQTAAKATKRKT